MLDNIKYLVCIKTIDKLILEFLNETNTSYYTIETLSVDDRINEIKGYLNEYF